MKPLVLVGLFLFVLSISVHAQAMQVDSISIDPSVVAPGQTFTLIAYVTNATATTSQGVQAVLDLREDATDTEFPFSIEPTDSLTRSLGTVPGFSTIQVKYQIRVDSSALDGTYPVTLRVKDSSGIGGTLTFPVEISGRQPILTIIEATPSLVKSGDTVSMQVTLKNTGSSPAFDIRVSLKEDRTVTSTGAVVERTILPLGAASAYASQLAPGSFTVLNIPILISPTAESKPTFVPVTLDYTDSAKTEYTSTDYIGLKVTSEPILDAIVADAEPVLVPGSTSKLTIDLFNQGLGPAKFVTVSVSSSFFTAPQTEFFIGTIESDDFDSVILDASIIPGTALGENSFVVKVSATNEYGDPISFTKTLSTSVYGSVPNGNGGDSPLGIIFVLALIGFGVWWFRFRKPKNGAGKK